MDKIVGVVGLGIMGGAMAKNLLAAGFRVVGFDVSADAKAAFTARGGELASSPKEVADKVDIVILSLPTIQALDEVTSGQVGLPTSSKKGLIALEMSTMPIEAKTRAFNAMKAKGQVLMDCPVSGTGAQAANKDLVVFGSGEEADYKKVMHVLEGMSRRQVYVGPFGNGSKIKFLANHLVTIHNVAAAEAFAYGQKAGLDPKLIFDVLQDSAGTSRMFQVRGPQMVAGRYDNVTATNKTHLKDLNIINAYAQEVHAPLPLFAAASQYYYAAYEQGAADLDTAAVCMIAERLAGINRGDGRGGKA
jgi:putative dehydrogenase